MKIKKAIYIVIGCIGVGLGAVGAALPFLPAFPFLLLAAVCFGKSSEKLDKWFKGTKLYKKNLETYVKGQGMTWGAKIRVMTMVSILMAIGFTIMIVKDVPKPALIVLGCVWVFHILYFVFGVKKYQPVIKTDETQKEDSIVLDEVTQDIEDVSNNKECKIDIVKAPQIVE